MMTEFDWYIDVCLVAVSIGFVLATIRLVRGPSLPDRVVALDLIAVTAVTALALLALAYDSVAFLDVAGTLALIAFVSTVAFARYLERKCLS